MAKRMLLETDKRLLWKLAWNMGFKGMLSVERHKRRLKRGEVFPPFLYISIINSCNLRCQGCWVDVAAKQETIKPEALDDLIRQARAMGNVFFGIVGGEPFMHPHLLDMLAGHPDCYFQVFTNGQFITDDRARRCCSGVRHSPGLASGPIGRYTWNHVYITPMSISRSSHRSVSRSSMLV